MFSGFLVDLAGILNWLSWIQWVSVVRYGSNMLVLNEFNNIVFCLANDTNMCPLTGSDVLDQQMLAHGTHWDMWKHFFALTMFTTLFLLLTFVQLLRMKKTR